MSLSGQINASQQLHGGMTTGYGKTAYQYALDGGFNGTEEEFAEKLAKEYIEKQVNGSVKGNDTVVVQSDYTTAFGKDSIVGCKAYYIKSIDTTNKKIYLSKTKVANPTFSTVNNTDASFETPAYEVGEEISIINYFHYVMCAKIIAISNNVIAYDGDLGFVEFVADDGIDGHTLYVATKPTVGIVDIGGYSFAEGQNNKAVGRYSHAGGRNSIAAGGFSHTEGSHTIAGYVAHAEGGWCEARGAYSHAEGSSSISCGQGSHAEGGATKANGKSSHAEGNNTKANELASHAEGNYTVANNKYAHAEGTYTKANGFWSHAEGCETEANAEASHAEGANCIADGRKSHAEGAWTHAKGQYSHSECYKTEAYGESSHAEGHQTKAHGSFSHAEGRETEANGNYSHAEGRLTKAGYLSHAEGEGTIATNIQHVHGKYNVEDTEGKYITVVGNGNSSNRSNAHTLDWEGNAMYAGSMKLGGDLYINHSIHLRSANGNKFLLRVTNDGQLEIVQQSYNWEDLFG